MDLLVRAASVEFHRANYLLDERYVVIREVILRVEILVRPSLRPFLGRHECVDLASCVLGRLVQENQETSQPTSEVGKDTLSLALRVERTDAEVGLG